MKAGYSLSRLTRIAVAVAGVAFAQAALADCKPVLSALEKFGNQPRVGVYEVDEPGSAPAPGEGTIIRIGKSRWMTMDGANYKRSEVEFPDLSVFRIFQESDLKGEMKCEAAGTGTYRGAAVVKYRFNNPMLPKDLPQAALKMWKTTNEQVRKFTLWIDKSSGLPVYEETMSVVGEPVVHAYVYGDAVKEPSSGKAKK